MKFPPLLFIVFLLFQLQTLDFIDDHLKLDVNIEAIFLDHHQKIRFVNKREFLVIVLNKSEKTIIVFIIISIKNYLSFLQSLNPVFTYEIDFHYCCF